MKRLSFFFVILLCLVAMQRSIYKINPYTCDGCGRCVLECDYGAIIADSLGFYIDETLCDDCGDCIGTCPSGAIFVRDGRVRISGSIFSASTNFYIAGAIITIGSITTTTDRFGNYYIETDPGTYDILFSSTGHEDSLLVSQTFEGDGCYQYIVTLNEENTENNNPGLINELSGISLEVYPNPFNPQTNIEYSVKCDSFVEISIYNVKGQKVITLLEKQVSAGKHFISWNGKKLDGSNSSSGIYFIRLRTGNNVRTIKSILMK